MSDFWDLFQNNQEWVELGRDMLQNWLCELIIIEAKWYIKKG